jgi:hypothetical protein
MEMNTDLMLNIGVVVLGVGAIGLLWYNGKKKEAFQAIEILVEAAEKKFGGGTGDLKYSYVVSELYPQLPTLIKTLVSADTLREWIEEAVDALQEKLKEEIAETTDTAAEPVNAIENADTATNAVNAPEPNVENTNN